jgi:hypothetical protein
MFVMLAIGLGVRFRSLSRLRVDERVALPGCLDRNGSSFQQPARNCLRENRERWPPGSRVERGLNPCRHQARNPLLRVATKSFRTRSG